MPLGLSALQLIVTKLNDQTSLSTVEPSPLPPKTTSERVTDWLSPAGTAVAEWPQRPEGHEPDAKRGSASAKFNSQSCGVCIVPPTSSEARRSHRSAGLENSQRSSSLHSTMLSSGLANTRGESSRDGGVVSRRVGPRAARIAAEDGHHLVHGRQHHFRGRVRLPRARHRPYRLKLRLRPQSSW